ncbi:hypothetical protein GOODEAATRI_033649 [Goodea atripinnis]|uniref:Uncharacterized protein n=1 Tax=Goodea atripinnis TaxID=208336 RepID=A0ABV0N6C5_9TELE
MNVADVSVPASNGPDNSIPPTTTHPVTSSACHRWCHKTDTSAPSTEGQRDTSGSNHATEGQGNISNPACGGQCDVSVLDVLFQKNISANRNAHHLTSRASRDTEGSPPF